MRMRSIQSKLEKIGSTLALTDEKLDGMSEDLNAVNEKLESMGNEETNDGQVDSEKDVG